jgi:hypothetical protein
MGRDVWGIREGDFIYIRCILQMNSSQKQRKKHPSVCWLELGIACETQHCVINEELEGYSFILSPS